MPPFLYSLPIGLVPVVACGAPNAAPRPERIPPTHANVPYGPHERNVLDFWKAPSRTPTALVVYIHGGGFRRGDKRNLNRDTLAELLDAGISVAAMNYRFVQQKRLPAAHHDCRRALQFLRSRAKAWNFDKKRMGAFGGSAGAQICMWLAFHDDMADLRSDDATERESTRLACVATIGGQTTMDAAWWKEWIPGYDKPHRSAEEMFEAEGPEALAKLVDRLAAMSLVSKDDPPIHMRYRMAPDDPAPDDPDKARGWRIHHAVFGVKLKEKMDALGVEADLHYPGVTTTYRSIPYFFVSKLTTTAR